MSLVNFAIQTDLTFTEKPVLIQGISPTNLFTFNHFPTVRERSSCYGDIVDFLSGSWVRAQTVLSEEGDTP